MSLFFNPGLLASLLSLVISSWCFCLELPFISRLRLPPAASSLSWITKIASYRSPVCPIKPSIPPPQKELPQTQGWAHDTQMNTSRWLPISYMIKTNVLDIPNTAGPKPCLTLWLRTLSWLTVLNKNGYIIISHSMYTSYNVTMTFLHLKVGSLFPHLQYGPILAPCF